MIPFNIPVAWLQLSREKIRFATAIAGVAFAVILMFIQFGFRKALFDSATVLHERINGDLFLISPQTLSMFYTRQFSQRRLYQCLGYKDVENVSPLYLEFAHWKNPDTKKTRSIFVIGMKPGSDILAMPDVKKNTDLLKLENVVLFDELSRIEFGPVVDELRAGRPVVTEIGNKRVEVGGLFKLGPSFGGDGNLITSDTNFVRLGLFRTRAPGMIDLGVVRVAEGADPLAVKTSLTNALPRDIVIMTRADFLDFEKNYWRDSTAIGFIFSLGAFIGFIVGSVIVYQILYSDVNEHLNEYATLKAIGYTDSYLLGLVFQEAVLLAVLGFLPGCALSFFLYELARGATSLPMAMDTFRIAVVLGLTVLMCCLSGAFATRKLRDADPADVF